MTLKYKDLSKEEFLRNEQIHFDFSVNYVMDMQRSLEDVKVKIKIFKSSFS